MSFKNHLLKSRFPLWGIILLIAALYSTIIVSCKKEEKPLTATNLIQYVDPYIGSDYHGHVFVGTSVPFGMVQLGPNNIYKGWDWCSGYHYSDSIVIGFSHTHLSGTGSTDLGDVLIMPLNEIQTERGNQDDITNGYASKYSHDNEVVKPNYYSLLLDKYNIKAELTTTERVGFHKYTYPKGKPASILIDLKEGIRHNAYEAYVKKLDDYTIQGYRYIKGWGKSSRRVYFVLKSDKKIEQFTAYSDNTPKHGDQLRADVVKSVLTFGDVDEVKLKVAISSVSCDNALLNLESELNHWDFDKIVAESATKWEQQLAKMQIETENEADKRIFYTAQYHTLLAPMLYCDVNGEYRGIDDLIYKTDRKNYSTFSLWDTYRALHPLITITQEDMVDDMVNSMLSIYDQQGKLPIWTLMGGETHTMVGHSSVPVLADAYIKGFTGFDKTRAFTAIKNSMLSDYRGLAYIQSQEYIPSDKEGESVAKALEYAIADGSAALFAQKLGDANGIDLFGKRAKYYKHYWDSESKFFRGKTSEGKWREAFDPFRSAHRGDDYCEGTAWQYIWLVPHDVYGLISLFDSEDDFVKKLDNLFEQGGLTGDDISPDISGLIGQYAHGNEPGHHTLYLYPFAGQQWKTAEKVRYVMDKFYTDKPDGIIGNEDCGQMSAWYLLSAMGMYQVNPSNGIFVFGSPKFDKVSVKTRGNNTFVIEAENNSNKNIYIQEVYLNGEPYTKSYINYNDIIKGGTLKFIMGDTPNKDFGSAKEDRPL